MRTLTYPSFQIGAALTMAVLVGLAGVTGLLADSKAAESQQKGPVTLEGEVVDLMCYLDHGAKGPGHADCARKCIRMGGPTGLLTENEEGENEVYLLIGEHQPINEELVKYAARTIEVRGKLVGKHGMNMLANAKILD